MKAIFAKKTLVAPLKEKLVRRSEGYFARPKKHIQKGYESSFTQRD